MVGATIAMYDDVIKDNYLSNEQEVTEELPC